MPSAIQNITATTAATAKTASSILGKDDFLKMLVMQLRYQDPLNPMKGTEFAAQLAQFSSVEQLSNINTNIQQSIDANAILTQSINNALAATFIGKNVRAATKTFHYGGTGDVKLGYTLPSAAATVTVKLYDSSGNIIRMINGSGMQKGDTTFTWDGKNDQGQNVADGTFTFSVEAKDSNGSTLDSSTFIYGSVDGVRFKSDGTVFTIDGVDVALSSILEIMKE